MALGSRHRDTSQTFQPHRLTGVVATYDAALTVIAMKRLLSAVSLSIAVALLSVSPVRAANYQEYVLANGAIPEASIRSGVYAMYDGVPRSVVFSGSADLSKMRVRTNDTVTVSYIFSIVSKGCGAVTVDRTGLAIGAKVSSRCVGGKQMVTEITRSNVIKAKDTAGGGGVMITTWDVPMTVERNSQFLTISMKVTAKGAGKALTLTGTRNLPNH